MNGHLSISVSLKDTPEILRVINLLQSLLPVDKENSLLSLMAEKIIPRVNYESVEKERKEGLRNVYSGIRLSDEQIKDVKKTPKELANESRRKKSLFRKRDKNGRWMGLTKSRPEKRISKQKQKILNKIQNGLAQTLLKK
jgi:hypothetical protein